MSLVSPSSDEEGAGGRCETMTAIDHNSSQPPLHLKRRGFKEN